jgi:hypothetical protein
VREDTSSKEVSLVRRITRAVRWAQVKLRRLRSLVKDEDHDTWYDDHADDHTKPPNVGPNLGGGGS